VNQPQKYDHFLKPGHIVVSTETECFATVVGSAVVVTLFNKKYRFGGLCHFVYPKSKDGHLSAIYGNGGILELTRTMKNIGSLSLDLEAHIIGGANHDDSTDCPSTDNIAMAERMLHKFNIRIASKDVGGNMGRKVLFNASTGEVIVAKTTQLRESDWHRYA
jgi:chemotaxis protein CheD